MRMPVALRLLLLLAGVPTKGSLGPAAAAQAAAPGSGVERQDGRTQLAVGSAGAEELVGGTRRRGWPQQGEGGQP